MAHLQDPRRRRRRVLGWGSLGLAGFYGLASAVMIPWVENDLTDRVEAKAAENGYEDVTVTFSGQDGTFHCGAPLPADDAEKLLGLAEDKWGVRVAELAEDCGPLDAAAAPATTVATTAAPTTVKPTTSTAAPTTTAAATTTTAAPSTTAAAATPGLDATATLAAGSATVTLSGTVETQDQHDQLVAAATTAFGEGNVVDQLQVLGTTAQSDARASALATLISAMSPNLVEGSATASATTLSLTGTYVDDAAKATVESAAGTAGVAAADLALQPRPEATADDAAQLEAELNATVGASPIPFERGSATLTADAGSILDQVAALAKKYAGVTIAVDGHTDADGSDAANLTLSQNRADTVRQALVDRGVPAEQLLAEGFGESQPIAPNDTPANKALNRRVVFAVATQ